MGMFTIMYETEIAPKLDIAISSAMNNEVKAAAIDAIEESANKRIYEAYSPKFYSRRMSFINDDGYLIPPANGNVLTVTATAGLQNLYGGNHSDDLGDVIANGASNFYMPFPRPWMDEGIEEHLSEIENALMSGMKRQGF